MIRGALCSFALGSVLFLSFPVQAEVDGSAGSGFKEALKSLAAPAKPTAAGERQNRVNWGGEFRVRVMDEAGHAPEGGPDHA